MSGSNVFVLGFVRFLPHFAEVVIVYILRLVTKLLELRRTPFYQILHFLFFSILHFFLSCISLLFMVSEPPLMAYTLISSSLTTPSTKTTTSPLVNPSFLLLSNMSSMMMVKLDFTNYIVWKHQIVVILEAYAKISFLDDSCVAPDPFLKDSSRSFTREPNLEYLNWKSRE